MLTSVMKDKVTVIKHDGTQTFENVKALVDSGTIFIGDGSIPLEESDVITRKLPNGILEKFLVIDTGFFSRAMGVQDHYQAIVKKLSTIEVEKMLSLPAQNIVNHISGANSRVNINSTDNSVNINNQNDVKVFKDVRDAIALSGIDQDGIEALSASVSEMEVAAGTPKYKEKFDDFMGKLANYTTVFSSVSPYIPQLTGFINQ